MNILLYEKYITGKKTVGMKKTIFFYFVFIRTFDSKSRLSSERNCNVLFQG